MFAKSETHFQSISTFIYDLLPNHLPSTGFIGGERPGNADFHVGAWLGRIAAVSGAKTSEEGVKALEGAFGKQVPEAVSDYWNAWAARDSWSQVYVNGLH
jgi:glutathione S-transferase